MLNPDNLFDNPNIVIGDEGIRYVATSKPACSERALKAWRSVEHKLLYYRRSDDKIWAEWGSPKNKHLVDNLEELKIYVKALAELPSLTLRYLRKSGINKISKEKEERLCRGMQSVYKQKSQYLEYFLLHNQTLAPELGFCRKKRLNHSKSLSKYSEALYRLIQEMWIRAYEHQDESCRWILHFDSIAQLWFAEEAYKCGINMARAMEPTHKKATIDKQEYYERTRGVVGKLIDYPNEYELRVRGDKDIEMICLDAAINITAKKLTDNTDDEEMLKAFNKYLKARGSDASYIRRCEELTVVHADEKKRLVAGRKVIG